MKKSFQINTIGSVKLINNKHIIELNTKYLPGLTQVEGFSHLQIVWWAHLTDEPRNRENLTANDLFKNAPGKLGIFGTRAPARPNPIMISTIKVDKIDMGKGIIYTPFIDAESGTPVLDIKPYFPMERVKKCTVSEWFRHWPEWAEDAMSFNWQDEINYG
ncbi:MAG: SAM-dependent methyltransferase [Bacteroidales bacterium]|nr:SAM-dependent methyltransferase [Bacteroidales bacterium]